MKRATVGGRFLGRFWKGTDGAALAAGGNGEEERAAVGGSAMLEDMMWAYELGDCVCVCGLSEHGEQVIRFGVDESSY